MLRISLEEWMRREETSLGALSPGIHSQVPVKGIRVPAEAIIGEWMELINRQTAIREIARLSLAWPRPSVVADLLPANLHVILAESILCKSGTRIGVLS
jgi:hypothetical protein